MNIAMGVRNFRAVGGAEKFTRRLAQHLSAAGHAVDVYAYTADRQEGIALRTLSKPPLLPRAMRDWATGRGLSRALLASGTTVTFGEQKTWGADVIRPGGGVEDEYWIARTRYAHLFGHPAGRYAHPKRYFDVRAEGNGYRHPALRRVIANSRLMRDQLTARYPGLVDKVEVIYNGVDEVTEPDAHRGARRKELSERHGLDPTAVWLLFVGHEFKRKGLRHALGALAKGRAAGMNVRLLVVGRDRRAPYLRQCVRLGISDSVVFTGTVRDMDAYYAAADALVLPTFYDPFANVTIEALGAGLPIVTTRQNGAGELVDRTAGWVLDKPEAEDVLVRVMAELADERRRGAMSEAARAIAANHLLKDKMKEMEGVLLAVAEEKQARRSGASKAMK